MTFNRTTAEAQDLCEDCRIFQREVENLLQLALERKLKLCQELDKLAELQSPEESSTRREQTLSTTDIPAEATEQNQEKDLHRNYMELQEGRAAINELRQRFEADPRASQQATHLKASQPSLEKEREEEEKEQEEKQEEKQKHLPDASEETLNENISLMYFYL